MSVKQVPSEDFGLKWENVAFVSCRKDNLEPTKFRCEMFSRKDVIPSEILEKVNDFECYHPQISRGDPFASNVCHFNKASCNMASGILKCEE